MPDTLGDKSFDDLGLILSMDYQHPMAPDTRDHTLTMDGKDGAWDFGADLEPLSFDLPCGLKEGSPESLQASIRAVKKHLFDSYGKPKTMKLIFEDEPDKYYLVRYSGSLPVHRIINIGKFNLPLTAFDPHAYFVAQSNEIVMESDIPIQSDVIWDTGIGSYSVTSPQTIQIINNGPIALRASLTIEGSGDNVVLSGNGMSFNLGSFADSAWVIDGKGYSIQQDGKSNLKPFTNGGNPIDLLPGSNDITISGSNLNLTITENLRYEY